MRVEIDDPEPAVADEEFEVGELDELSPEDEELSPEDEALSPEDEDEATEDAVVDVEELSPLLSLTVCEAVSHAARKSVAAKSAIRR